MAAEAPKLMDRVDMARAQLVQVIGEARANSIFEEVFHQLGHVLVDTPEDLMKLSQFLIARGGFVEVVGRSLKAQALLAGAKVVS
jgi:hypothetical protein